MIKKKIKKIDDKMMSLASIISIMHQLNMEVEKRVQAGWRNWQRLSGVMCDRILSAKRKGKVYKVAVRPAITYGAETGAIKKAQEKKLNTTEMRMLRWACGQTLLDHVEN